ncbi:hypothetical protein [Deinococcus multiflagellatus]|uniref:Uncharacterized protein n=1 Tax=Deinococcus multiflagellatus TaxID=1656887 RepID=A0ABW1ZT10_9DEIO|nr:hypothetical protein [Deinococcus multiflagellatus]MBZ9714445.1 hypothetical protein [Deinococcus multiflagellatus]
MKRLALFVLLSGHAGASAPADLIQAAQVQVVAFLPQVQSYDVSEALRQVALRGRRVTLITTVQAVQDPKSYLLRLAHVPGVVTHLVKTTGAPFVVVDGRAALSGPGLAQQGATTRSVRPELLNQWAAQIMQRRPTAPVDLVKLRYLKAP